METIRQVVDGKILSQVITLPVPMRDSLVEIIVTPFDGQEKPALTRSGLRARLQGSHTESLSGALPSQADTTLEEFRAERRLKYERAD